MSINKDLLTKAGNGNERAQYELYRQLFPLLMSVCTRYHQDEQSAVASLNAGFLKILNNHEKHKAGVPLTAWIRRIMINTLIDEFRKRKKYQEKTVLVEDMHDGSFSHAVDWNEADQRFGVQQLEALIRRLPPMTMKVFNLFAVDGYSHLEIGEMLNISDGTSKWHVSSARKQLKIWIGKELVNFQGI